jgi:diaminopimelate decarboxylase
MESTPYLTATKSLLAIADNFENLECIDLGGGFGVPYREKERRLNLKDLGRQVDHIITEWVQRYGKEVTFQVEPGRYIVAESGILLGTVYATKINYETKYVGTDLGFNVLMRPVLYNSVSHGIEIYRETQRDSIRQEEVTIVGNICETGDIIAQNRLLPEICEGDILGVLDVGAYGYSMSSNYNNRLRPAEVLIKENGEDVLIRKRESPEDLMKTFL